MSSALLYNLGAFLALCCVAATASGQQSLIKRGESDPNRFRNEGQMQSRTQADRDGQSPQDVDSHFAACLLRANLAEVELATTATDRASSQDVREFAQQLIKEHNAVAAKLEQLASNQPANRTANIEKQISDRCLAMLKAELESKSGKEFDACFLGSQVAGHMQMIASLEVLARNTSGQLQQIVKSCQPTAQSHYDEARQLMKQFDSRQASSISRYR